MAQNETRAPTEQVDGCDVAASDSGARSDGRSAMVVVFALLGFACAAYCLIIFSTHSGTPFFAVWLVLAALLFMCAWGAHVGWWAQLTGEAKWALRIVVGLALVWLVVTQAFALSGFGASDGPADADAADYLIILGSQVKSTGPSIVLQERLDTAVAYLVAHPHTRCIVSGGQGFNEPEPEAHVMARYLAEHGVDEARIAIEDTSRNTVQNVVNCKALLDASSDRVYIVTSNFHVFRGVALARKQGYEHVTSLAAPSNPFFLPNNMLRESFSITKELLAGNL